MVSKIRTCCARYFMSFKGKLLVMQKDVCKCPNPKHTHIQNSKYKSVLIVIVVFLTKNWLLSNTRCILCWNSIVDFKNCHYFPHIPYSFSDFNIAQKHSISCPLSLYSVYTAASTILVGSLILTAGTPITHLHSFVKHESSLVHAFCCSWIWAIRKHYSVQNTSFGYSRSHL